MSIVTTSDYDLRDYQRDCARAMFTRLVKNVLIVLPTGAGKTITFAKLAAWHTRET